MLLLLLATEFLLLDCLFLKFMDIFTKNHNPSSLFDRRHTFIITLLLEFNLEQEMTASEDLASSTFIREVMLHF